MSDKTKKLADDAFRERRYREMMAWERLHPPPKFLCACGTIAKRAEHEKDGRVTLYCEPCALAAGLMTPDGRPR